MKLLIWAVTAVVLLFGTLMVGLAAAAAQWLAGAGADMAQGAQAAAQAAAQMPVPAWLAVWVDPALIAPLREMMLWSAAMMVTAAPWLGPLLGWVAPVLWISWALVVLLVLALAAGLHWLAARGRRPSAMAPVR